jgi:hypothetical protein
MDKTRQRLVGSRLAVRSGWVRISVKERMADIAFEQQHAVCCTDVRRVIRVCCGL